MSRARDTANQINRVNSSAADATAITIDSNNNVGIGTIPSATYSAFDTIEFETASITSQTTATAGNLVLGSNMNYSSGGGPEYKVTGKATQITQIGGDITLGVATSGTANTNITYNTGLEVLNNGYARAKNGLLFGTDTAAANALEDYEEGTYSPQKNNGGTVNYSQQNGWYTKVGNLVTVYMDIEISSASGESGNANITLPFTAQGVNSYMAFTPWIVDTGYTSTTKKANGFVNGSQNVMQMYRINSGNSAGSSYVLQNVTGRWSGVFQYFAA